MGVVLDMNFSEKAYLSVTLNLEYRSGNGYNRIQIGRQDIRTIGDNLKNKAGEERKAKEADNDALNDKTAENPESHNYCLNRKY